MAEGQVDLTNTRLEVEVSRRCLDGEDREARREALRHQVYHTFLVAPGPGQKALDGGMVIKLPAPRHLFDPPLFDTFQQSTKPLDLHNTLFKLVFPIRLGLSQGSVPNVHSQSCHADDPLGYRRRRHCPLLASRSSPAYRPPVIDPFRRGSCESASSTGDRGAGPERGE